MASKKTDSEKTSAFKKEIRELLDSGLKASKKGLRKASKAISEFGDVSVIKIDITKFKVKLEKKYVEFGKLCSTILIDRKTTSVTKKTEGVEELIAEIEKLKKKISDEEKKLKEKSKSKSGKSAASDKTVVALPAKKSAAKSKADKKTASKTEKKSESKKTEPKKTASKKTSPQK